MSIPRPEYPRPQFVRERWVNLNGDWQFEFDHGDSGIERGILARPLARTITVPFCPESALSGIGDTDRTLAVWYRRSVTVPRDWDGCDVHLHFGAVDYDATVWVNGSEVRRHRGGFTSFTCDLRGVVRAGEEAVIVVRARDDWRDSKPRGKQAQRHGNHDCLYTRTTGIWQTVWMEPVSPIHLRRARITPDVANSRFRIEQPLSNNRHGYTVRATLADGQGTVSSAIVAADIDLAPHFDLPIPENRWRLWSASDPHLYQVGIELVDDRGHTVDRVASYAGLRSVSIDGKAVKINGERVFQRLVLDQGYYRDGLMTAPTDDALIRDIELSMSAGFNGARLHQKVFEERFLYHADRLGYLCWGEFGDWSHGYVEGHDYDHVSATFITQWHEAIERDYSHPSIIGWCPTNELIEKLDDRITELDDVIRGMFLATKALDQTRPVIDISGFSHRVPETDIFDTHDYEQDAKKFHANQVGLAIDKPHVWTLNGRHNPNVAVTPTTVVSTAYRGQPFMVSEFGGMLWNPDAAATDGAWGYGSRPKTLDEFHRRFEGLVGVLLDDPHMFGYCYTQLTDVFQEQNGLFTFDRRPKFDLARLAAAQRRLAAFEQAGRRSLESATRAPISARLPTAAPTAAEPPPAAEHPLGILLFHNM
jgi:beta-galactosidase/beta-glucuronidase